MGATVLQSLLLILPGIISLELIPLESASAQSLQLQSQTSESKMNIEENQENAEEVDTEAAEEESESKIPPNEPNPFKKPNIPVVATAIV